MKSETQEIENPDILKLANRKSWTCKNRNTNIAKIDILIDKNNEVK